MLRNLPCFFSLGLSLAAFTGAASASAEPTGQVVLTLSPVASAQGTSAAPDDPASAEQGGQSAPRAASPPEPDSLVSFDLTGHYGALIDVTPGRPDSVSGMTLGGMALLHVGGLALGGAFDATANLSSGRLGGSGVAGWSHRLPSGYGVELLGAFGVHHYDNVGRSFLFTDDPGVSGNLPFVGGRVRIDRLFRIHSPLVRVGGSLGIEHDLETVTRSTTYKPWLTLGDESLRTTSEHTLGFTAVSVALDVGLTFE